MSLAIQPCVILVRPQMGENIGATARAMLNFGLTHLRIVAPRDGWPNKRADDMAAGAFDKMPPVAVFNSLPEAIADLHYVYATTARMRDITKPVFTPNAAARDCAVRESQMQKTGFIFGAERAGLSNDDIAFCQSLIHIPANPDFSSLNLGQAVLLIAYEYFQHASPLNEPVQDDLHMPATQDKLEEMLRRLEDTLSEKGFFRTAEQKPTMTRNIRAMFARAELSDQEVRTFQGILTALTRNKKAPE
ncbi:MAG: RNA methyltransferase [Alphaproteobacteria bacterium]|nr:RNA methyltransferase [Alphaproteobacteria bacterium]